MQLNKTAEYIQMQSDRTKQRIGIIGGGQLGKMMILEAKKLNFYVIILDPTKRCPAASIADEHIIADFDDRAALIRLADRVDVITYEFEHIDSGVLRELEEKGHNIYPTARSLEIIQDKYIQKVRLAADNIPVPAFRRVEGIDDILQTGRELGYPLMLKSCTGGYDGKGNAVIEDDEGAAAAYSELGGGEKPLMVEEFIHFIKEISVLACRDIEGSTAVYTVGENEHRESILYETRVPAAISGETAGEARDLARRVMDVFSGTGMFCVEMFLDRGGRLFINEIAPRPHNSGHYSIEGAATSQFEQHIRAVSGLPLGDTELIRPAVMRNILGTGQDGPAVVTGIEQALKIPGVKVHIYGKEISRAKRKMGHITATAATLQKAVERVGAAGKLVQIKGLEGLG